MNFMNLDTNAIYDQLSKIEVHLERQNTYNRDYIDHKMIECDAARDVLDKINTKVTHELTNLEIHHSILEEEFNNKKRNELTNNNEVLKKYNTGKEREAAVELILNKELSEISKFSRKILALKNLSGVIKTKQSIMTTKLRNLQDQFRMMCEYLKANVGSANPNANDPTVQRMAKIYGELDKLAEDSSEFNTENVEDTDTTEETIEQESNVEDNSVPGNSQTPAENDAVEVETSDIDDTITNPPVTDVELVIDTSADVDISGIDLGNNDSVESSDASVEVEEDKTTSTEGENSEQAETSSNEEEESSELDMDSVLDGIGTVSEEVSDVTTESDTAGEGITLEDVLTTQKDEVISDEPTTKQKVKEEPAPKIVKSQSKGEKSKKKVVEDSASVSSNVDIDNILDDLSNM
jgi:hypothetical protein